MIRFGVVSSEAISNTVYNGANRFRSVNFPTNYIEKLNQKNGFFIKLEQSILESGIKNPILCYATDKGTLCRYGTSRLWVAKKHKLNLPVIIADYIDRWTDLEILETEDDVRSKFVDQPEILELGEPLRIDACPHIHLSD